MKLTIYDIARFHSKLKETSTGCLEWQGTRNPLGYGVFSKASKKYESTLLLAHRVAYTIAFGEIPEDKWVCHKCDNRACCAPKHLFLGTPYSNNRPGVVGCTIEKEQSTPWSERTIRVRGTQLSKEQVEQIKQKHQQGVTIRKLCKEYDRTPTAISNVIRGRTKGRGGA